MRTLLDAAETMQRLMRTWTSRGIGTNVVKVWRAKGLQRLCCARQTLHPVPEEATALLTCIAVTSLTQVDQHAGCIAYQQMDGCIIFRCPLVPSLY